MIRKAAKQSGAALLTVLVAMMIISILLFEFQYASMVERKLAYNDLNQLQAYYMAKSGIRIGLLRVALYGRTKRSPEIKNMAKNLPIDTYLDSIWSLPLPAFPPTEVNKEMLKDDRDAAEKALKQTRTTEGQSTHVITSESAKINLNFLAEVPPNLKNQRISFTSGTPQSLFEYVGGMLVNLMENFLKDSDDPSQEFGNLRPEEVVFDIMDWVTPGNNRFAGGAKDSWYESQNPPYKSKKNRFYTVDELKLVRGIDDHLYNKLKPYITVYSYDGKININTASNTMIRALFRDFTEDDVKRIQEERTKLGAWVSEKQFVDYVSGTLGRGGFKTLYADEKNYPFTIMTQSFLIESMGVVRKSKSSVQKIIRVAVAFTAGKGGTIDNQVTDPGKCAQTPGRFWHQTLQQCRTKTKSDKECVEILAGTPYQDQGKMCCQQPNGFRFCIEQTDKSIVTEANAMKLLYWSET